MADNANNADQVSLSNALVTRRVPIPKFLSKKITLET